MPKARFFFLNIGHSIDHLFMLMFPAVAALAAVDLSSEYGDVLRLATGSFIAFGVCSLPMGWLADRLSREFMISVFLLVWEFQCSSLDYPRKSGTLFVH